MVQIFRHRRWLPNVKPTVPVEINWAHPDADGLLFYQINGLDLVTGSVGVPVDTTKVSTNHGPQGFELESNDVTVGGYAFAGTKITEMQGSSNFTIAAYVALDSVNSDGRIVMCPNTLTGISAPYGSVSLTKSGGTTKGGIAFSDSGTVRGNSSGANYLILDGVLRLLSGSKNSTTTAKYYRDGTLFSSNTSTLFGASVTIHTDHVFVLTHNFDVNAGMNGRNALTVFWKTDRSAEQHASFYADPYALLKPRVSRVYFIPSAAFSTTEKTVNVTFTTAMSTTPVPIFLRAFNVTFGTTMALVKQTQKTLTVNFPMAVAIAKETRTSKAVGFVTNMTLATATVTLQAIAFGLSTSMSLAKTTSKAISVAFSTAMSVAKETRRTFSVGFTTGFALVKTTKPVKAVSFVTSMALTKVLQLSQALSFSTITTMVTTSIKIILKAISFAMVTAMSTVTSFTSGDGVFGRVLWLIRRRRR